jgi:SpoVK/Ycf46/Vps4 family AAA+-type ATPase
VTPDQPLIEALQKVIELSPADTFVRSRLAELLLKSGDAGGSLKHCQYILAEFPDQTTALNLAAEACEALGEEKRAAGYRRLRDALSSQLIGNVLGDEPNTATSKDQAEETRRPSEEDRWPIIQSDVRLNDVAGLVQVKQRLQLSFFGPLERPELREVFRQTSRGGLLLYGPPGCGKTFLAKAIAGELQAGFMSVSATDVKNMWFGNSEKLMRLAFKTARTRRPCVLFFDEVDAIAQKRSDFANSGGRGIVNQFLSELDGVDNQNEGLYVIAATNHPWDIDVALKRPGRFDRVLFVSPPDEPARFAIAERLLSRIPNARLDFGWIASHTEGFSGADVAHLCNSACEYALEESMKSSRVCPVEIRHVKGALKEIRPSMRPWFETAKNYAIYSNESGQYDDLLAYVKSKRIA